MIFIGIDVSSLKHDVCIISDQGEILLDGFILENNQVGFDSLHQKILPLIHHPQDAKIGIEETGIYHDNIRDFLINHRYIVYTINPILTSFSRKSASPRKTKTDKVDAFAIARYIMMHYRSLNPYLPSLYHAEELKSLSRLYFDKRYLISERKSELKRLLSIVFPEFLRHFNPFSQWSLDLLKDYPTPKQIERIHMTTLLRLIKTHNNHESQCKLLKSLAKNSIGNSNSSLEFLISSTINDIHHYESQKLELKAKIATTMKPYTLITSIPGIGSINGALILGEIGDIHRFHSKFDLVAFAGIDPSIYESGKYHSNPSKLSKRGSKYLRSALFMAARVACVGKAKDNKFRDKYLKKISEGKHHYTAVFAAAKNMIQSIYSILKYETVFDPNR